MIFLGNNFKTLDLKSSYETGQDDLIEEFYAPVLKCAASYNRIAGFFSSTSLAVAAKGIAGLIRNNGKMRLISCPRLDERDVEVIKEALEDPGQFLEGKLGEAIQDDVEDSFQENHLQALGWMLAHGYLEIKLALVCLNGKLCTADEMERTGVFHQKAGILTDLDGNKISFSGSINETASGWLNNIEEFKVFRSWNEERKYLKSDEKKFQAFWENTRNNVRTYPLPEAVRKKLIEKSRSFSLEGLIAQSYKKHRQKKQILDTLGLFPYQKEAVGQWEKNGCKLLLQMATGTGKTRTALGCMARLGQERLVVVVACPQGTLSLQWKAEVEQSPLEFGASLVADGTNRKWKSQLQEVLLKVAAGIYENAIIFTTHAISAKKEFAEAVNSSSPSINYLFVGDEAHGFGALGARKALLSRYGSRVGLSATPSRWYDESGTRILEEYFGDGVYEFSIRDALTTINPLTGKTFLAPYQYHLEFVGLTDDELEHYSLLSSGINKLARRSKDSDAYRRRLEHLLFQRANIIKGAENKYGKLKEILKSMGDISGLIIFVSPEQLETVLGILYGMGIPAQGITKDTGTAPEARFHGLTERQHAIKCFQEGYIKALVAIKCLDEGIDIPSAKKAILLASSMNPREYIQRVGRVIRQAQGKKNAEIWDISIRPCKDRVKSQELRKFEQMVCEKEKVRIYDMIKDAQNSAEALKALYDGMGG